MNPMDKMDIFKTTDRGLAAFAMLLGFNCIGCVPSNHADVRRMDFVFIDVPNPKGLEDQWHGQKKVMFSPYAYFQCLTQAIWMVKHPMTREEVEALRA